MKGRPNKTRGRTRWSSMLQTHYNMELDRVLVFAGNISTMNHDQYVRMYYPAQKLAEKLREERKKHLEHGARMERFEKQLRK